MRKQSFIYSSAALLAATLAAPSLSRAATATANMNVTATVTAGCTMSVSDLGFGNVTAPTFTSALTSSTGGLVSYTCGATGNASPSITFGQGGNWDSANHTNRMLGTSLGGYLPYSLTVGTVTAPNGNAQTAQVTATIPIQSTLPAVDTYSDVVVVTLNY